MKKLIPRCPHCDKILWPWSRKVDGYCPDGWMLNKGRYVLFDLLDTVMTAGFLDVKTLRGNTDMLKRDLKEIERFGDKS